MKEDVRPARGVPPAWILILACYALIVPLYDWLRFRGLWIEQDTSAFSRAIGAMASEGILLPRAGYYSAGYGYQVIGATLAGMTGLAPVDLLSLVWPFQLVLVVPLALCLFRELTESWRLGAFATLLLLLQPEFLFGQIRGNHEKISLPLTLFALWLLARSFASAGRPRAFALYVALFYLAVYGLIATNLVFGASFIVAVLGAVLLGTVMRRPSSDPAGAAALGLSRLVYTATSCVALAFAFMFYLYPVSSGYLDVFHRGTQKVAALAVGAAPPVEMYDYVQSHWVHPWVYPSLMSFSVVVMAVGGWEWLLLAGRVLLRRGEELSSGQLFGWVLATVFGLQLAASAVADRSGFLSSNLVVRVFPTFMFFALCLAAGRLAGWLEAIRGDGWERTLARTVVALLLTWWVAASLMKATNEPVLTNVWMVYSPTELAAVEWVEGNMRDSVVWVGPEERVRELFQSRYLLTSRSGNGFALARAGAGTENVLLSPLVREAVHRFGGLIPEVESRIRSYDNGTVTLYHRVPVTPFQR